MQSSIDLAFLKFEDSVVYLLKYQVAHLQFCNSLDRCLSFMFQFYCTILAIVKLLLKIMKEYLLKQPKATCVLFSIACKINLGLVKNNGNPGGRGGSLALEIRVGGGVTVIQKIRVGGGVKKPCHPSGGCGFFLEQPIISKILEG